MVAFEARLLCGFFTYLYAAFCMFFCKRLIYEKYKNAEIEVVFRADKWADIKNIIKNSDHVFFACLAIRPRMHEVEYPYLSEVLSSGVPFSVVSAGTQISSAELNCDFKNFTEKTISLLKEIDKKSSFFSTRGVMTQYFCEKIGVHSPEMTGDIALSMYANPVFETDKKVKRIAISDPHNPQLYLNSIASLFEGLAYTFPGARIEFFLHGINQVILDLCNKNSIPCKEIYKDKDKGLDHYKNIDLHVGFRVHGHVTALSNGIYSYLLEQDGRGMEYGLTFNQRISVSDWREPVRVNVSGKDTNVFDHTGKSAKQLISMIKNDARNGFDKFPCLEKQLRDFIDRNKEMIESVI